MLWEPERSNRTLTARVLGSHPMAVNSLCKLWGNLQVLSLCFLCRRLCWLLLILYFKDGVPERWYDLSHIWISQPFSWRANAGQMFILIGDCLLSPHLPYPYLHFSTEIRPISPITAESQTPREDRGFELKCVEQLSGWAHACENDWQNIKQSGNVDGSYLVWTEGSNPLNCWKPFCSHSSNKLLHLKDSIRKGTLTCCPTVPHFRILSWPCLSSQLICVQIEYFFYSDP